MPTFAGGEDGLYTVNGWPVGLQPQLRKMLGISHLRSIPCTVPDLQHGTLGVFTSFAYLAMRFVFTPPVQASVPVVGQSEAFPVHRIYCVGRNYAEHAKEMGFTGREAPFFFVKPADAVLPAPEGSTADMPYPSLTQDLHHEIELVVAIGKGGKNIPAAQAFEHIWGYAVGLDMTRRDLQGEMKKQGRPWCIGKAFEHSAPIGAITPAEQAGNVQEAEIWLQVNGQDRQRSHVTQLIWNIAETIEHLSRAWELQPGDLIMTGTPEGVGAVQVGDLLEGGITGLSPLRVRITA
jgi:fumarylpyruvate hydrolase